MDTKESQEVKNEMNKREESICSWFYASILIGRYAEENLLLGKIGNGEQISVADYLYDLGINVFATGVKSENLSGPFISDGKIAYDDFDKFCYTVYGEMCNCLFWKAPVADTDEDDELEHYKNGLYEYLKDLYVIFRDVVKTEVEYDWFSLMPDISDKEERRAYDERAFAFVNAIRVLRLKVGGCVSRYFKGLPYVSPFLEKLVEKKRGRYFLKINDVNSLEYKLALLSCLRFIHAENTKLFELKMKRWEERYRTEKGAA